MGRTWLYDKTYVESTVDSCTEHEGVRTDNRSMDFKFDTFAGDGEVGAFCRLYNSQIAWCLQIRHDESKNWIWAEVL